MPKHWVMAVSKPDDIEIRKHIGRMIKVTNDAGREQVIPIEDIKGSLVYPTRFQIDSNGKSYTISMLDFFAQMNGEKITPEEIAAFEATTFEVTQPVIIHSPNRVRPFIPYFHRPRHK